jgi:hypothetical protein
MILKSQGGKNMKISEIIDNELTTPAIDKIGIILDEMAEDIKAIKEIIANDIIKFVPGGGKSGLFKERGWEK